MPAGLTASGLGGAAIWEPPPLWSRELLLAHSGGGDRCLFFSL
jgi:hypothetical protein